MIKRLFFPLIILLLLVLSVNAYTLRDEQNFDNLTTYNVSGTTWYLWLNETGNEWYCSVSGGTYCAFNNGAGGTSKEWWIKQNATNKYLHVDLVATDNANYYRLVLHWDHEWVSAYDNNITLQYDIYPFAKSTSFSTPKYYRWQYNINLHEMINSTTIELDESSDICNTTPGQWNRITQNFYFSVADGGWYERTYINDQLCSDWYFKAGGISTNYTRFDIRSNDGDFYLDNIRFYDGLKEGDSPLNITYECSDSIDNDGDGFIDYPDDPSCLSSIDDTENPFDTIQCNDTIDNDGDGFIDYPDDPSCDNSTDNNEFPISSSSQPDDTCLVIEKCILYDTVPYSDDPALHSWYGDLIESTADYEYLGGYSIFLDNYIDENGSLYTLSAKKNITNSNNYNNVDGSVFLSFIDDVLESTGDYSNPFYINFLDYDQNTIFSVRLNFSDNVAIYDLKADVYATNLTSWVYVGEAYFSNLDYHFIRFYFDLDQTNNNYNFYYEDSVGITNSLEYAFTNSSVGNIYTLELSHAIDPREMEILFNLVELTGADVGNTVCTDFNLPYYLIEEFNGDITECDWSSSHNIFYNGQMYITQDIELFYAQKLMFGTIEADNTRYVTLTYDLNIINVTTGDTITFRLYDEDGTNFFTVYYRDSGDDLWYNEDGTGKVAKSSIPLDQYFEYKYIIDLDNDEYDIYFNDTNLINNVEFTNSFLNIETVEYIKITSNEAEFKIDNVKVFASDDNGDPFMPDDEVQQVIDDTIAWCGLFHKTNTECVVDSDCETGDCLPSGKCNRFDMTYCDENGHTRGNKCIISGMTSCVLESTAKIILDNFLLFLVFLILIILVAYVFVMAKS